MKKQSSEGRFLILKVSTNILYDHFPLGAGLNSFPFIYPQYQASFYEKGNMSESEILRADSTSFAFNEFLQTACELGFVGVLLIGTILGKVLIANDNENKPAKFAVLSILFSSVFYYAFHSTLILLFTLLILSLLFSGDKNFHFQPIINRVFYIFLLTSTLFISRSNLSKYSAVKTLDKLLIVNNNDIYQYKKLEHKLSDNTYFLYHYSVKLFMNSMPQKSLKILSLLDKYKIWYESEILKGNIYVESSDLDKAKECYANAINICPGKFNARYKLLNVYRNMSEKEKALNVALEIIKLPEKVPSATTLAIKMEAESYINEYKN
ncbi:hypothetical protein AGMMS50262_10930 [Bacteroidia bacterium]|nr:hypothetical protein AGMMS50262_10930 [Bacteroidia bacterium]